MSLAHRLIAQVLRIGYSSTGVAVLYHTPVGLKARNQLLRSEMVAYPFLPRRRLGAIDPKELRLGIDGLTDEHTLLDRSIGDSPHYSLMGALDSREDLAGNPYVLRSTTGTLDFRLPREATQDYLEMLRETFRQKRVALEGGASPVVKVVQFSGRRYVADGKHAAALALLAGVSVEGEDATPFFYDSYVQWMRSRMQERPALYSKHLALLAAVDRSRTREEPA